MIFFQRIRLNTSISACSVKTAKPLVLALLASVAGFASVAGCASPRSLPSATAAPVQRPAATLPATLRPSDGLLEREDLQVIVDRQLDRRADLLRDFLDSPDADRRARAAFALASVQDTAAVDDLARLLSDRSGRVRADAAFALGQTADSSATPALLRALAREDDEVVLVEVLAALGKVGDAASLPVLAQADLSGALEPARAFAIAAYGRRGLIHRTALARLVTGLTAPDPLRRHDAAYFFGRIADADAWALAAGGLRAAVDSLGADDPALMHLALGLGHLRRVERSDSADARQLYRLLRESPDWRVRTNAARSLAAFSPPPPAPLRPGKEPPPLPPLDAISDATQRTLFDALGDPSPHVRVTAAQSLRALGAPGLPLARWLLQHKTDWRPAAALLPAIFASGPQEHVAYWLEQQGAQVTGEPGSDPAPLRPLALAAGLQALGTVPVDQPRPVQGSLVLNAEELDNLLRLHADHPNTTVAAAALEALGARWNGRRDRADAATTAAFYGAFSAGLVRRDLATTTTAAQALADTLFRPLGVATLLEGIYAALQAPDDVEPMVAILGALAVTGDTTAIPVLVAAASQGHPVVRQAAAAALEQRLSEGIGVNTIGISTTATPSLDWAYLKTLGTRPRLVLETARGQIAVELLTEQAPQTVQTIARTAEAGRYDGVPFHRIVPNFVAQGGDVERGDGYGGPGYAIRSEFTRVPYRAGVAGIASAGKDTEGSQFFFTHSAQPHLDGRYTAFGRIVVGDDVLDALEQGDLVTRATLLPTPQPDS